MTWAEANQFLIEQVRSRWPVWKPTDMEIKDWCRVLSYYAKDVAREAMFNYVKDANRITRRPLIAVFITKAKLLINKVKMPEKEEEFRPEPGRLYGKAARDKVFTAILSGEEGRTKRWLIDFLRANPTKIPPGASLSNRDEAEALPSDSVGSILQTQTAPAAFRPNPDWINENPEPSPNDDIPF